MKCYLDRKLSVHMPTKEQVLLRQEVVSWQPQRKQKESWPFLDHCFGQQAPGLSFYLRHEMLLREPRRMWLRYPPPRNTCYLDIEAGSSVAIIFLALQLCWKLFCLAWVFVRSTDSSCQTPLHFFWDYKIPEIWRSRWNWWSGGPNICLQLRHAKELQSIQKEFGVCTHLMEIHLHHLEKEEYCWCYNPDTVWVSATYSSFLVLKTALNCSTCSLSLVAASAWPLMKLWKLVGVKGSSPWSSWARVCNKNLFAHAT